MSVAAEIKQDQNDSKKLTLEEIIQISGLSYGIADASYRLIDNETGDYTLLFETGRLARGIEVSFDQENILLRLSLPTSREEIHCFYETIRKICDRKETRQFLHEEEWKDLDEIPGLIENDIRASIGALEDLREKVEENEYKHFQIFGICFPISLGKRELEEIANDLDRFADFMNRLQSMNVYYSAPKVYDVRGRLTGIYFTDANLPTVFPTEPYIVMNQVEGIEEWYVMLKDQRTIPYQDFIGFIRDMEYFDADHILFVLTEEEVQMLADHYAVEI